MGSPIFRHVRIWRGKCTTESVFGSTVSEKIDCNYDYNGGGNSENNEKKNEKNEANKGVHKFPEESSYFDVVALGTTKSNTKVKEIRLNNDVLVNMNTINDKLLQNDGVLRFVMEGEVVNNVLPVFYRNNLLDNNIDNSKNSNDKNNEKNKILNEINNNNKKNEKDSIEYKKNIKELKDKENLILLLRSELKHSHAIEEELNGKLRIQPRIYPAEIEINNNMNSNNGNKDSGNNNGNNSGNYGLKSYNIYMKMFGVTCMLLFVSLIAFFIVGLFEYFGIIDKKNKDEAYVV